MSNRVNVQFTRFQNIDASGNPTKEPDFGYRIYDDYDAEYNNTFESAKEMVEKGLTPENIIRYVADNHYDFYEPTVREKGLTLNGQYIPPKPVYDYEDYEDDDVLDMDDVCDT